MKNKVDIYVKEMELTQEIREYIDKKIPRLERYLDQIDETRIDLAYVKTARESNNRFVAQITLRARIHPARRRACKRDKIRH
jgi:putative sigma-54 modulation protein